LVALLNIIEPGPEQFPSESAVIVNLSILTLLHNQGVKRSSRCCSQTAFTFQRVIHNQAEKGYPSTARLQLIEVFSWAETASMYVLAVMALRG